MECSFQGCESEVRSKGLCSGHYQQQARGKLLTPIKQGFRHRDRVVTDTHAECSRCMRLLLLEEFTKGAGKGGLATWCQRCFVCWRYGISRDDYDRMFLEQGGLCAACYRPGDPNLHIDHDHSCCLADKSCGRCVRGLLCGTCNRGLGMFGDDPVWLRQAAAYLERTTIE